MNREPFATEFRMYSAENDYCRAADAFYDQFRCPLVHECGTSGQSKILAEPDGGDNRIFDLDDRGTMTVYRNNLRASIDKYCESYRQELLENKKLQESFIRKYDQIAGYVNQQD
ncbi:hypothetical protein ACFL0N_01360 [Pseudomonadota bacterium]